MNKTFQVNISGEVFYIDEDAYSLLKSYLEQLHQAFSGAEGNEIVNDIEARIAEIFAEKVAVGSRIITLFDVNEVIARMGRAGDLCAEPDSQPAPPPFHGVAKKLYRNMQNRVFGGVLGGLACYLGWNATAMRWLVAIVALCTYLWPMIIIYIVAWMIIPAAATPSQVLQMSGTPVTITSLGQSVMNPGNQTSGVLGKVALVFLGIIAAVVGVVSIKKFIQCIVELVFYSMSGNVDVFSDVGGMAAHPVVSVVGQVCFSLVIALPCIAIVAAACSVVFDTRPVSRKVIVSGLVAELVLVVATIVLISIGKLPPFEAFKSLAWAVTAAAIPQTAIA